MLASICTWRLKLSEVVSRGRSLEPVGQLRLLSMILFKVSGTHQHCPIIVRTTLNESIRMIMGNVGLIR